VHVLIETASPPSGHSLSALCTVVLRVVGCCCYRLDAPLARPARAFCPHCLPASLRIALVAARPAPSGFDNKALNVLHGLRQQQRPSPPSSGPSHALALYLARRPRSRAVPVEGETRRLNLASSQTGCAFTTCTSRLRESRTSITSSAAPPDNSDLPSPSSAQLGGSRSFTSHSSHPPHDARRHPPWHTRPSTTRTRMPTTSLSAAS
jgi:hypothetical protein